MPLLVDYACGKDDIDQVTNLIEQGYDAKESNERKFKPSIYRQAGMNDVLIEGQQDMSVQAQDGYDLIIVCSLIEPIP